MRESIDYSVYKVLQSNLATRTGTEYLVDGGQVVRIVPIGTYRVGRGREDLFDLYTVVGKVITTDFTGACKASFNQIPGCGVTEL